MRAFPAFPDAPTPLRANGPTTWPRCAAGAERVLTAPPRGPSSPARARASRTLAAGNRKSSRRTTRPRFGTRPRASDRTRRAMAGAGRVVRISARACARGRNAPGASPPGPARVESLSTAARPAPAHSPVSRAAPRVHQYPRPQRVARWARGKAWSEPVPASPPDRTGSSRLRRSSTGRTARSATSFRACCRSMSSNGPKPRAALPRRPGHDHPRRPPRVHRDLSPLDT